jgi:D-glycero-alpha-D-manno-heptose 1-phosphate guanylyltransferase
VTEAVILAGGRGTRLLEVVADRPKPMAEVAGRPFVEWLVLALQRQGVRRVVFSTGHQGAVIERHFEGGMPGVEVVCVRESEPLGTGGGVRNALAEVRSRRVLVLNGDSYCAVDLARLESVHERRSARATIWLAEVDDVRRFGSVILGPAEAVTRFEEKSSSGPGLVNAGVYLFERSVLEAIAPGPASLEKDVLPALVGQGLCGVVGAGPLLDIGTPESYRAAQASFAGRVLDVR